MYNTSIAELNSESGVLEFRFALLLSFVFLSYHRIEENDHGTINATKMWVSDAGMFLIRSTLPEGCGPFCLIASR